MAQGHLARDNLEIEFLKLDSGSPGDFPCEAFPREISLCQYYHSTLLHNNKCLLKSNCHELHFHNLPPR